MLFICRQASLLYIKLALVFISFAPNVYAESGAHDQVLAFPGADGFGRYTQGGRGGEVYYVTNLKDYDSKVDDVVIGSLRHAIESRTSVKEGANNLKAYIPRTVVFSVSGTIVLKKKLRIREPLITIAGQTAPGDGITIRDYGLRVAANNVIIRYIRSRLGNETDTQDDAVSVKLGKNIMIDHCSISWSIDEAMSNLVDKKSFANKTGDVDLMTVQWSIISESLNNAGHVKGRHGYGGIIGGYRQSYHHNLFAHHRSRNPKITWRRHTKVDFRNNVIYNWGTNSSYDGTSAHVNWVNNYYKPGPATNSNVRSRIFEIYNNQNAPDLKEKGTKFYINGNYFETDSAVSKDNWLGVDYRDGASEVNSKMTQPFNYPRISQYTPSISFNNQGVDKRVIQQRYRNVLQYVGASHARDSVDERVVEDVFKGRASNIKSSSASGEAIVGNGIIDSQTEVGGWPKLNSEMPPLDTDRDGMPNSWEDAIDGLDKNDASDRNKDLDGDGYTELEEYLNSLVLYEGLPLS